MSRLDCALRELESATAAVGSVPVEDFAEARAAMDRRAWAIADLAAMVAEGVAVPEQGREQILSRLRRALEAGRVAEQRLVSIRSAAAVEWSQWTQIYRALGGGASNSTRVDFCG